METSSRCSFASCSEVKSTWTGCRSMPSHSVCRVHNRVLIHAECQKSILPRYSLVVACLAHAVKLLQPANGFAEPKDVQIVTRRSPSDLPSESSRRSRRSALSRTRTATKSGHERPQEPAAAQAQGELLGAIYRHVARVRSFVALGGRAVICLHRTSSTVSPCRSRATSAAPMLADATMSLDWHFRMSRPTRGMLRAAARPRQNVQRNHAEHR